MPLLNHNIVLDQDLTAGSHITFAYPAEKDEASFFGAFAHTLVVNDVFHKSPVDFTIKPTTTHLELHWHATKNLKKGDALYMRLEELGTYNYYDQKTNTTLQNTMASALFMVNLRAPNAQSPEHYLALSTIEANGTLPLKHQAPDVPRNVIISSTANDTDRHFRIDGLDCYNRPLTEILVGPNAGIRQGRKAFAKIARIAVDGPCQGKTTIGYGNRLGLPVFLPAPGYVIQEMANGDISPRGLIIPGDTGHPTASSGDRRGTYTPSPTVELNGRTVIYLLLSLPNPGNIGSADYAAP